MKIMFVTPSMRFGGAERVMSILLKEFADLGHDVFLHIMDEEKIIAYELDEKIKLSFSKPARFSSLKNICGFLGELKLCVNNINPDIIVSFFNNTLAFAWWVRRKSKITLIFSERNDPNNINGIKSKFFQKIALKKSNYVVFQTRGAQNCYGKKVQKKSTVIANPFSVSNMPKLLDKERTKRIVSVGRLNPQKNQKILIQAFANISNKFPKHILEIYGEGELRQELETLINENNLKEKVFLPGASKQVLKDINDAEVFAFSSDFEGMPNALIEAMALGLPCISTDCSPGGAREFINSYENGILVPCNDVAEMAKAMEYMLENKNEAEKMGGKAKNIVNDLTPNIIAKKWINIFEMLQ